MRQRQRRRPLVRESAHLSPPLAPPGGGRWPAQRPQADARPPYRCRRCARAPPPPPPQQRAPCRGCRPLRWTMTRPQARPAPASPPACPPCPAARSPVLPRWLACLSSSPVACVCLAARVLLARPPARPVVAVRLPDSSPARPPARTPAHRCSASNDPPPLSPPRASTALCRTNRVIGGMIIDAGEIKAVCLAEVVVGVDGSSAESLGRRQHPGGAGHVHHRPPTAEAATDWQVLRTSLPRLHLPRTRATGQVLPSVLTVSPPPRRRPR